MKLIPYTDKLVRNLVYHIWPARRNPGVWQWNVSQLLRRMDSFNGQRIVSVVTDDETDSIDAVKKSFQGTVKDFFHFKNNPTLGEVVSFEELMDRVDNIDPRQITFYGHAKGTKYKPKQQIMVKKWTESMYSNMLDYPELIEDVLRTKTIVGTFLKIGNAFGPLPPSFHFAGTFFWFRNIKVFSKEQWKHIPKLWWGTEAWPGIICHQDEVACMLEQGTAQNMQLYAQNTWRNRLNAVWEKWQIQHAKLHRLNSYSEVVKSLKLLNKKQIIVTGPQRSGTVFTANVLAKDLGLPLVEETAFDTHNLPKFMEIVNNKSSYVMQAPGMSPYVHTLTKPVIIWMHRNVKDILRSQIRIDWTNKHEKVETDKYFTHDSVPASTIKTDYWERFQRHLLEDRAYDLDYESLKDHPMWVDKEDRVNFGERQCFPPPCYPPPTCW